MTPENALSAALQGDRPESIEEVVDVAGGRPRLARLMSGIPLERKRLPARGTRSRTRYESAMQSLRRYTAEGAKRRLVPGRTLRRMQRLVAHLVSGAFIRRLRSNGARARVEGWVFVAGYHDDGEEVHRQLPQGGPGVYLSPAAVRAFTRPYLDEDLDEATAVFFQVFGDQYGVEIEPLEIDYVKLWPEGTAEPA